MKRLLFPLLMIALLTGCAAFGQRSYVVVEPHDEGYEVALDSSTITVNSYLSLKNAILGLVEDAVEEGVIRAESYSGDLSEDLSGAVYEVSRSDPLGAFAVDYMTYDYSQIVSYYEIHIHTTYRRTLEEIQSVVTTSSVSGVKNRIQDAMNSYSSVLLLRVSNYKELNVEQLVDTVYQENPELALEKPEVELTTYPESGSRRILELEFQYVYAKSALETCREKLTETVQKLTGLYGSENNQYIGARRLLTRLIRDGNLTTASELFADSAYGALCLGSASTLGYCQACILLLQASDINCQLTEGTYLGESHLWVEAELEGETYIVDPTRALLSQDAEDAILLSTELSAQDYEAADSSE